MRVLAGVELAIRGGARGLELLGRSQAREPAELGRRREQRHERRRMLEARALGRQLGDRRNRPEQDADRLVAPVGVDRFPLRPVPERLRNERALADGQRVGEVLPAQPAVRFGRVLLGLLLVESTVPPVGHDRSEHRRDGNAEQAIDDLVLDRRARLGLAATEHRPILMLPP